MAIILTIAIAMSVVFKMLDGTKDEKINRKFNINALLIRV